MVSEQEDSGRGLWEVERLFLQPKCSPQGQGCRVMWDDYQSPTDDANASVSYMGATNMQDLSRMVADTLAVVVTGAR